LVSSGLALKIKLVCEKYLLPLSHPKKNFKKLKISAFGKISGLAPV
jgi:hypothetical protein